MAQSPKIWRKKNGQWVKTTPDVTKADVGLGNVENFTHTNSATDGSSSKYATGSAVKQAYDRASAALSKANQGLQVGGVQLAPPIFPNTYNEILEHRISYDERNKRGMFQIEQILHTMGAYMLVARDRSDTILTGCKRTKLRNRAMQIRAFYRRVL